MAPRMRASRSTEGRGPLVEPVTAVHAGGALTYTPAVTCANCGTENPADRKFCGQCGASLALVCAVCGTANEPRFKFCGECGSPLSTDASSRAIQATAHSAGAPPASERRLVSVLFADIVGFTPLSEHRDPDDVRDLLSRYFDTCRELIARSGG